MLDNSEGRWSFDDLSLSQIHNSFCDNTGKLSLLDCWLSFMDEDTTQYCAETMDLELFDKNLPFWFVDYE